MKPRSLITTAVATVGLALAILVTRVEHFGTAFTAADATLAVLFLAGMWIPRAWLFAIATNLTRNHFRSEKRRRVAYQAASIERREADPDGPESEARFGEAKVLLESTVGRLPLKQRQAFIMRKIHDLDYEAIGQSLDCSAESARAHVFQALRKIRLSLDGQALAPTTTEQPR